MNKKEYEIFDSGKKLFFRFGPKRVTVEDICREAGVSKATYYKYFRNKEDLIKKIRNELLTTGFDKFDEICKKDITYPKKIEEMSKWRINFFSHIPADLLNDIVELDLVKGEFKNRFLSNIEAAQKKGEIKKDLLPDLIWLITEKISEITKEGLWKEYFSDYATYQSQVRRIIFYGMLE